MLFLIAFFFYIDGVLTAIGMANTLAVTTFGFASGETGILFLVVQFSARLAPSRSQSRRTSGAPRRCSPWCSCCGSSRR